MVLSKKNIRDRLSLDVTDPRSLVITPLLQYEDAFDNDSVDLRLGTNFILSKAPPEAAVLPSRRGRTSQFRVHVPLGSYLVVPAHHTVLGATLEFIKFPYDASGLILTKSSVARTFLVIETAPWIHPFYRGCLTLEIANVSNTALLLYPGRLIGQLILMEVRDAEIPTSLNKTYLGPVFPESPVFNDPEDDLERIGIEPGNVLVPEFRR
jgi:dCTP deaminase